jgi:hypothetical protein
MINFFNYIFSIFNNNIAFLEKYKINSFFRFFVVSSSNLILPIYFKFFINHDCLNTVVDNRKILVSLTSFPNRINSVWLVIESIFRQTLKPDKLILWLSNEQFKNGELDLPLNLLKQKSRGLDIFFVDGDLLSHKKYYYSFSNFKDYNIITVDDDIIYADTLIENLYDFSICFPDSICSQYVKKILISDSKILPYKTWPNVNGLMDFGGIDLFFGTGGGTIFTPKVRNDLFLNKEVFMKLTPYADDVWLNFISKLYNINVIKSTNKFSFLPVFNFNNYSLTNLNNDENLNDSQISDLVEFIKINYKSSFVDDLISE